METGSIKVKYLYTTTDICMSTLRRGARNVFRNPIRTIAVVAILGISLGMIVVMMTARRAVEQRITEVKANIGNTITISPAGARGFLGGGEALTTAQLTAVSAISHVTRVDAIIDAQLGSSDTNLQSGIEAGSLGGRGFRAFRTSGESTTGSSQPPANFTPPIFAVGTNNGSYGGQNIGTSISITSGKGIDGASTANEAVIGTSLAEKNALKVGSTFTAYSTKITVVGIYDAGNTFANNTVIFPLATLQKISSQSGQITSMVANVDSVDTLTSTTSAITASLGSKADVTSSEDSVKEAIKPLENIKTITTTSLVGALIAASVITLLTMVMIVRC
jgi:putative ABC transport system permease protein